MKVHWLLLCFGIGLLGSVAARAQPATSPHYRNLVMEGGGIHDISAGFRWLGGTAAPAFENLNPVPPNGRQRTIHTNFLNFSPRVERIFGFQKQQLMDSGRKGTGLF